MIKIGDFVTSCEAGYWQLIDVKPKIATEDYVGTSARWKKGDVIGKWAILKKAFTPKMKPKIDFSYVDSTWVRPVSAEIAEEISKYFRENPDYKAKFESAVPVFRPMITNCWLDLPEECEEDFRRLINTLPPRFTMDEFWKIFRKYKSYLSKPPVKFLLNLLANPFDVDRKGDIFYHGVNLEKMP